jgi:hypothetical protein
MQRKRDSFDRTNKQSKYNNNLFRFTFLFIQNSSVVARSRRRKNDEKGKQKLNVFTCTKKYNRFYKKYHQCSEINKNLHV